MPKINCFSGGNLPQHIVDKFNNSVTDSMSEIEERELGHKIALEYHKELHEKLNTFKKSLKLKPNKYEVKTPDKELEAIKREGEPEKEGLITKAVKAVKSQFTKNDTKNKQGVQSNVGGRQKPVSTQPIERGSGKAVEASGVVQTSRPETVETTKEEVKPYKAYLVFPNEKEAEYRFKTKAELEGFLANSATVESASVVRASKDLKDGTTEGVSSKYLREDFKESSEKDRFAKAVEKEANRKSALAEKFTKQLDNADDAYPTRAQNAYNNIIRRAKAEGLTDVVEDAEKRLEALQNELADKQEKKETKEGKPTKTQDQIDAERKAKREEREAKEAVKFKNKKIQVKKGLVFEEDGEHTLGKVKDVMLAKAAQFLRKATDNGAKNAQENLANAKQIVKDYVQLLRENRLPKLVEKYGPEPTDRNGNPITEESVLKKISQGDIRVKAGKQIQEEKNKKRNSLAKAKILSAPLSKPLTKEQANLLKAGDIVGWKNPRTGEIEKLTVAGTDPANSPTITVVSTVYKEEIKKGRMVKVGSKQVTSKLPISELYTIPTKEELAKYEAEKKEENDRIKREKEEEVKKALAEELGLNPNEIEDINFVGQIPMSELLEHATGQLDLTNYKKEEITFEDFKRGVLGYQNKFVEALWKVINRYKGKEGNKTKFYKFIAPEGAVPVVGGFHLSLAKSDTSYIVIVEDSKGNLVSENTVGNVPTHELVHDYTKMMYHRLYKTNKAFAQEVQRVFVKIRNTALDRYEELAKRLLAGNPTEEDMQIYRSALDLMGKEGKDRLDAAFNAPEWRRAGAVAVAMQMNIYGLTNVDEMMAEGFSNPRFMTHLATIKLNEKIEEGAHKGERKSLLYKWYQSLTAYLKKQLKEVYKKEEDYQTTSNALDYLMDFIAGYDSEFIPGNLIRNTDFNKSPFQNTLQFDPETEESNYNTLLLAKVAGKKPQKLNSQIVKNIFSTLRKRKEIKTLKDVQEYINRVNGHLPKDKQLGEAYAQQIFTRLLSDKKAIAQANVTKGVLLNRAMSRPEYKTSYPYKTDVDNFYAVKVEELNPEQRADYLSGFMKLANNLVPTQKEYNVMINFGMKEVAKKELTPVAKKLSKTYLEGLEKATNAALFSSVISKFNSVVGDKILKNVYAGLMKGFSKAITESTELSRKVNKVALDNKLTHKDVAAIGIYGSIFSTVADPSDTVAWREEVLKNTEHAVESANNKMLAYENKNYKGTLSRKDIQAEIDAANDIATKISKTSKMEGILSKGQQAVYDTIREFTTKHEADFERNAVSVWGKSDYVHRYNYFPTIIGGKVVGSFDSSDILYEGGAENLYDAVEKNPGIDPSTIKGKASKAQEKRNNAKGYYYEFDATTIASRHSKNALLDVYTSTEFKKLNRLMKDNEFRKVMTPKLIRSFTTHIQHIASSGNKYSVPSGIGGALLKIRDNLYTSAIATSGQILLQSISGVANAAVIVGSLNPIKATKNLSKALVAAGQVVYAGAADKHMNEFYQFLKNNGLGIQIRDIFFEKYTKASDSDGILGQGFGKWNTTAQNFTEAPTRWGDKYAAASVFFAAYFDAGGTIENPNKDAIIRAERMVGVLQNMSDVNFSAPMFRSSNQWQRHMMMMLYAFKSFALNSELALLYSLKYSVNSPEARKIATAQLASVMSYRLAQGYLVSVGYKMIAQALLGDDGDDDEEKRYSWWKDVFYNSMWDMLIGGYSPAFVDGIFRYFFNRNEGFGLVSPNNGEEFDKYLDSPLYSPKDVGAIYKGLLGPGTSDIVDPFIEWADMDWSSHEEDGDWEKAEQAYDKRMLWGLGIVASAIGATTYMPLRGDAKRIMEKAINEHKSRQFKAKRAGGGSGEGEPVEEFVFPDGPEMPVEPIIPNE